LVVDDSAAIREAASCLLRQAGFVVDAAESGENAIECAKRHVYGVIVVDLMLPGMSGLETINQLRFVRSDVQIVILTAWPSLDSSIAGIRCGVCDYLRKPQDFNLLPAAVQRAAERWRAAALRGQEPGEAAAWTAGAKTARYRRVGQEPGEAAVPVFVGQSQAVEEIRHCIATVAPIDMNVLIQGESGTGKDIVARLIHEHSGRRKSGAFVKINCPAIPETLLESEMFGHEAGAFTGAVREKPGRFEIAEGGTVFLDEIAEMPPGLQVKLLQVIEQKRFVRLGGRKTTHVDVRIVAATNAPLQQMLGDGRLRTDLFYRLNEFSIVLPPLRERTGDIPLLAQHFLSIYGLASQGRPLEISGDAMALLCQHSWPGNVRELEAVIRRFALTGREDVILAALKQAASAAPCPDRPARGVFGNPAEEREAKALREMLNKVRWNRRKAAALLGISYCALRYRIVKYGLEDGEPSNH
jgi:DNA-binding NtrC family response regulator